MLRNWRKRAIRNLAVCCGAIWRRREKPQYGCTTVPPVHNRHKDILKNLLPEWLLMRTTCSFRAIFGPSMRTLTIVKIGQRVRPLPKSGNFCHLGPRSHPGHRLAWNFARPSGPPCPSGVPNFTWIGATNRPCGVKTDFWREKFNTGSLPLHGGEK